MTTLAPRLARVLPRTAIVALALACAVGCVPEVKWFPDSSGFVFADGDQVVHYSLERKAKRTFASFDGKPCAALAIRPDGKQVAALLDEGGGQVRVVLHDHAGKAEDRRDAVKWTLPSGYRDNPLSLSGFAYSTAGDRLLLPGDRETGVYDVATKKVAAIDGVTPFCLFDTPVRPDGKGFVAARLSKGAKADVPELLFVDWDGWEQKLDTAVLAADLPKFSMSGDAAATPLFPRTRWKDGHMLVLQAGVPFYDIDTAKRSSSLTADAGGVTDLRAAKVGDQHLFPGGETAVRTLETDGEGMSVAVVRPKSDQSKVIVRKASGAILFPSPDGKHVAIVVESAAGRELLLIDDKGVVVDQFDMKKGAAAANSGVTPSGPKAAPPQKPAELKAAHKLVLGSVKVRPTKADGKGWDVLNGAPDIEVRVKNTTRTTTWTSTTAQDTYATTFNEVGDAVQVGDELVITVTDKDISDHDFVGETKVVVTEKMLKEGVKLAFDQVSELGLTFKAE